LKRTAEQIRQHYDIEKELAFKLRSAPRNQRRILYTELYNELFRRVPDHPQLTARDSFPKREARAVRQARFLRSLVDAPPVFLEIGAGDCLLSRMFANHAERVYAVDVSDEITGRVRAPVNLKLIISDGCSIPIPASTVDLAYSNQLMEHLHPEDAIDQLRNVFSALKPGGKYLCITPNRLSGPHDISQHFDNVATGFHLHEYTLEELIQLCRSAGFSTFAAYIGKDGYYVRVPILLVTMTEKIARRLPASWGKFAPLRLLLGIRLLSTKPG
jgi:SAM-dependent methyltransferase